MKKYIQKYSEFLLEQDALTGMGMPAAPAAPAPTIKKYEFLFMTGVDDAGTSRRKYPDGSTIIEYPSYSISAEDLSKWMDDNIISTDSNKLNPSEIEVRKNNILELIKGTKENISNEDLPFIEKLKNAVSANLIGKKEPDITVVYTKDGDPTTTDVNVTFIKHKK
jgi:hypothetical protein